MFDTRENIEKMILDGNSKEFIKKYVPTIGHHLVALTNKEFTDGSTFHHSGTICHSHKKGHTFKIMSFEVIENAGPWKTWVVRRLTLKCADTKTSFLYDFHTKERDLNGGYTFKDGTMRFFDDFYALHELKKKNISVFPLFQHHRNAGMGGPRC